MKPVVSVCVPTYNGAKYIKECLDSILSQTFKNFEIIVVDDQSSDATLKIVEEYAINDDRIYLSQNQHNLGLVGNWNRCVELAQGEWIKFVFQDDLIKPTCLEQMLAASKSEIALVCCRRDWIFEPDATEEIRQDFTDYAINCSVEKVFPERTSISALDYCQGVLTYTPKNFVGEPTSVMLHRSVFRRFGNFNPHLIMFCDIEFWNRVAINTGITYVKETLATFRVHGKATSSINHAHRRYRGWVLDELIMIHDYAFHPVYAPLRTAAANQQPPLDLTQLVADKAYDARKSAEYEAVKPLEPNPRLMEDWQEILQYYPILSFLAKRSFLKRVSIRILGRWRELSGSSHVK